MEVCSEKSPPDIRQHLYNLLGINVFMIYSQAMPELSVTNLSCQRGGRSLFEELSFVVSSGQVLQVSGANGSGKTSLLRILCGLLPYSEGSISWQGVDVRKQWHDYRSQLAYVGHKPGVKAALTVVENLQITTSLSTTGTHNVLEVLTPLKLACFADKPVHELSAGQQRRVALARLLLSDARLWILDEPLTSLDRESCGFVWQLIENHVQAGGIVILTSHQAVELERCALQGVCL